MIVNLDSLPPEIRHALVAVDARGNQRIIASATSMVTRPKVEYAALNVAEDWIVRACWWEREPSCPEEWHRVAVPFDRVKGIGVKRRKSKGRVGRPRKVVMSE